MFYFWRMKILLNNIKLKEWGFQTLVLGVLFIIYSFDKESPSIGWDKLVFFCNYVFLALLINYYFLPNFFYKKKYLMLFISLAALFTYAYFMEEYVLEKLFYSDHRGKKISNFFFTLLDIMPLILTIVGFKFVWDASKKQNLVEQLQSSVKESELRFLKSQINPHFLFNNLNNLYSYSIENSPKTPSIILELSSVLRYMLYDCKEDYVTLIKELEHIKNFVKLNELQIEKRGKVTFLYKGDYKGFIIAPLILIVFIENAFKHSTASQIDNIFIEIDIHISHEGVLKFTCLNSYLPNSNNESISKGIGLQNVKKRLEILYPDNHKLSIRGQDNVYKVNLVLQLVNKKPLC